MLVTCPGTQAPPAVTPHAVSWKGPRCWLHAFAVLVVLQYLLVVQLAILAALGMLEHDDMTSWAQFLWWRLLLVTCRGTQAPPAVTPNAVSGKGPRCCRFLEMLHAFAALVVLKLWSIGQLAVQLVLVGVRGVRKRAVSALRRVL